MKLKFIFWANILLMSCIIACTNEISIPKEVIPKDKMVEVMTDIHLIEGQIQSVNMKDTAAARAAYNAYHFIYYKHRIDSSLFRKSWNFYATHPALYDEMQEKVIEKLNKMQQLK